MGHSSAFVLPSFSDTTPIRKTRVKFSRGGIQKKMDYCPVITTEETFKDVLRSAMTPTRKVPSQNIKHALKKDGVCVVIFVQRSSVLGVIFHFKMKCSLCYAGSVKGTGSGLKGN